MADGQIIRRTALSMAALLAATVLARRVSAGEGCEHFDSTFALVQDAIFERHGCTSAACHTGSAPAGGLDLTAGVSYDALIDQPPQTISTEAHPGIARVVPGNKARSLLWLNLAAGTLPALWTAPLRPMPQGGLPPLSLDELRLVQLWIENGAVRDGVVPGTAELFGDVCLPPPEPLHVEPLAPPPPGTGIQLRAPHQVLAPQSERETCFVSHYDVTDQVPPQFRGAGGTTFRYKRIDARQDPLSHHAVVIVYRGQTPIESPVWGPFACRGGAADGAACNPKDTAACGDGGICASPPVPAVACIGYGPGDAGIGTGEQSLFNTMGTSLADGGAGVYDEAPLQGILVWNSHAFNVTDQPAGLDMWINFAFAAPDEQRTPLRRFVDISALFNMHVPPYGTEEICNHHVLDAGTTLLDLTSHTHWRGRRFRVFDGAFGCAGGPHSGAACSPYGVDPGLPTPDICRGAPCTAPQTPRAGDCNADLRVDVNELVIGVGIALGDTAVDGCPRFDADGSGTVTIDELLAAVGAALGPTLRDPDASLLYTSITYADPLVLTFQPPRTFGAQLLPAERTLTYCALYDNGFSDPACAEGQVERPCSRDAQCDTQPGAGDGACDACTVGFGVSTDDEMFVLVGSYVRDR
jgi:hypothetical protein